jgi:pimeloyl-ACP methyl ester carboxylesterase
MNQPTQLLPVSGGMIAYDVTGEGPLVVCLPGLGDVRGQYRFIAPLLVAAGHRVITADLRGHGESSMGWSSYTPEASGADLVALLSHLGQPAAVIANSFAAASAVWAAAESPQSITALGLLGPFVREIPQHFLMKVMLRLLFMRPWGPTMWGMYYASLYPNKKPADFDQYKAALVASLKRPGAIEATRAMIAASKAVCEARTPEVKTKALIIMGEKDPDFSSPVKEANLAAELLRGDTCMISEAGHYPHTEFPERVIEPLLKLIKRSL